VCHGLLDRATPPADDDRLATLFSRVYLGVAMTHRGRCVMRLVDDRDLQPPVVAISIAAGTCSSGRSLGMIKRYADQLDLTPAIC
jgi:hypothetical protein